MNVEKAIEAIRNHPEMGIGSCSVVDECYSDQELAVLISTQTTIAGAVNRVLMIHEVWKDRADDIIATEF